MKNTKVVTVIVNRTRQELVLRVGNHNCFAKVATIVDGGEHKIEIDVNWTYQEFCLEPTNAGLVLQKIILSSDDCCDFELMTVTISEGKLQLEKVARGQTNDDIDHRPVVTKWMSLFTSLPAWPKFNWRF